MKSQRAYQILVVFMLILPLRIFAQQQIPLFAQKIPHMLRVPGNFNGKEIQTDKTYISDLFINNGTPRPLSLIPRLFRAAPIDAGFAIQSLPFFCKKEFLFERTTSIPLRVRLGSLDYVNKLEGKENHWSVVPGN